MRLRHVWGMSFEIKAARDFRGGRRGRQVVDEGQPYAGS
ncbi:hypothetical protein FM112_07635 [Gulosibacter sp. 10]|nr:hypothetical protein FM112_07635 [Gulosibacter sp. 10]